MKQQAAHRLPINIKKHHKKGQGSFLKKDLVTAIKTITKMKVCVFFFCRHVQAHCRVIKAELCYYYFMQHYKVTEVQCLLF